MTKTTIGEGYHRLLDIHSNHANSGFKCDMHYSAQEAGLEVNMEPQTENLLLKQYTNQQCRVIFPKKLFKAIKAEIDKVLVIFSNCSFSDFSNSFYTSNLSTRCQICTPFLPPSTLLRNVISVKPKSQKTQVYWEHSFFFFFYWGVFSVKLSKMLGGKEHDAKLINRTHILSFRVFIVPP